MNRIAKIDTCGNNHARLFDADGAQIGGLEAARMAVEGNVPCPGKSWFRTAVEAAIANHESEREGRA